MTELTQPESFIAEDEINEALAGSSPVAGGKLRIYTFFRGQHTLKEQADFLKKEYGICGHTHSVSNADHSNEDHSSKGMKLQKRGCVDVQMTWNNVAKRITALIAENRYLNAKKNE